MNEKYLFLTQAPVHRVIGAMAFPTIISMLLTSVYNLVDTFFVGQIDTQSTAAVGIVFSVMFFIQAFSFFFGNGSGNYISRQLGAQKVEDAETMASTGLFYTFVFSILTMLIGLLFLEPISVLLGSTPTILPYTRQYLGISLLGTPFIMATFCINNQMRFQGFAKYSVYGVVGGSIINCLLDPLFIFGLSMGVRGAALASVVGQLCGFVILLGMSRKEGVIHYSHRKISFEGRFVKEIIAGGTPSISRQGLASLSTIALNSVAGNYGDAAIAAMSIVTRISMFIFSVIIGIGQGFQPMCGFCYGAKRYDRVKKGFWFSTKIGTAFLLFWAVILILFSEEAVALFRNDPDVITVGIPALRYQMILFPACSFMVMANMMMQTCRKTIRANILAASRQGLFFIPLIIILPRCFGLLGVEICQAVSDLFSLIVTIPIVWTAFREMKYRNDCGSCSDSRYGCEGEPMFVLQSGTGANSAVSSLILQVWEDLPNKDWFAIDGPGYLSHILSLKSTLVFEAYTPEGKLAAVCVLVKPETEEENLSQHANIPRSEWHQVMHVDIAATLPAYRGHSLQSRLMAHAECFLRKNKDTKYLMATVHPNNLPSRRSVEKLGYTCVAQTSLYGGLPRCVYWKRLFV